MTEQTRSRCVSVHESEVIGWWEIGWHFAGVDTSRQNYCLMEWRSDKPPVAPFRDEEFSSLVAAVASLEGRAA